MHRIEHNSFQKHIKGSCLNIYNCLEAYYHFLPEAIGATHNCLTHQPLKHWKCVAYNYNNLLSIALLRHKHWHSYTLTGDYKPLHIKCFSIKLGENHTSLQLLSHYRYNLYLLWHSYTSVNKALISCYHSIIISASLVITTQAILLVQQIWCPLQ